MRDRRAVLAEQRASVLVDDGASRGAQAELSELVTAHLARVHPTRFALGGVGSSRSFTSRDEGLTWRFGDFLEAPLLLAGQLVQEDLCLVREERLRQGDLTSHVFASGVVIDSFDPVPKHLLPMLELHGPVPGYARDLHASMARVFSSLRRPLWRANFSFYSWSYEGEEEEQEAHAAEQIVERLCLKGYEGEEEREAHAAEQIVERLYLKVEYETIRRLPEHSDYLVFTIRAHMDPLASLAATPLACAALAAEIRRMPGALLQYKGLADRGTETAVLDFLDRSAAAARVG